MQSNATSANRQAIRFAFCVHAWASEPSQFPRGFWRLLPLVPLEIHTWSEQGSPHIKRAPAFSRIVYCKATKYPNLSVMADKCCMMIQWVVISCHTVIQQTHSYKLSSMDVKSISGSKSTSYRAALYPRRPGPHVSSPCMYIMTWFSISMQISYKFLRFLRNAWYTPAVPQKSSNACRSSLWMIKKICTRKIGSYLLIQVTLEYPRWLVAQT